MPHKSKSPTKKFAFVIADTTDKTEYYVGANTPSQHKVMFDNDTATCADTEVAFQPQDLVILVLEKQPVHRIVSVLFDQDVPCHHRAVFRQIYISCQGSGNFPDANDF